MLNGVEKITQIHQEMSRDQIIKEYVPFMVKEILKKTDPPKDEKNLIEYSQALVTQILDRVVEKPSDELIQEMAEESMIYLDHENPFESAAAFKEGANYIVRQYF